MRFKNSYIKNILLLLIFIFIQKELIWLISVSYLNITPDFVLIVLILIGIKEGHISGAVYGFFAGLLFDFLTGSFIGLSALTYSTAGFVAGYFYSENDRFVTGIFFSLAVFSCSVFGLFLYYFIYFQGTRMPVSKMFLIYVLTTATYTTLISLIYIFIPRRKGIERNYIGEA